MFRVKTDKNTETFSTAERILLAALFMALTASCVSLYLVFQERHLVDSWHENGETHSPTSIRSLQRRLDLQVLTGTVVLAILLFCHIAFWRLRRRFLLSQQSLRHVKMLAHDILASMDRGVVTIDCEGVITSINSAGIKLLGVDFECVGAPVSSISLPETPLVEVCREVMRNLVPICDRDTQLERGGRLSQLRLDAHVLKDGEGAVIGCAVHLRDVTERMLLDERMRRMEGFLSMAMLAAGLHHEIKNPLTALSIHLQLLDESLSAGAGDSRVGEFVGVLKTEVYRLNGVLERFRSFANLQQLVLQSSDVLEIVANVIRLIEPQAAQQNVRMTLAKPERQLPVAQLDRDKIEQAVLNVVINALEAMPNGGNLAIKVAEEDGRIRIAVEDSGTGISPEVQRNLFRPYFSTKSKGSGIGLALSEKFISQHKGHIEYRTGKHGTVFEIVLPYEQATGSP
ncbi:MAG: PAS domain-containing protein [Planctomycetia bacterium]|nr:PAS domain-containing protein [Planctomycetia bacterium]